MNTAISTQEFDLLRKYIEEQCGIALGDEKAYLIETRLMKLMVQNGCDDFGSFYRLVKDNKNTELRDKIVDAMTTNETLWFRDVHPYAILREKLLPALSSELAGGKRKNIRIWSAACSTGQEPYSIALTVSEYCKENPRVRADSFEILGTDISPSALFVATTGRYDQIAVSRGLPEEMKVKYFKQDGRVWSLDESVKKLVRFQKFNLQNSFMPLGHFDIVFLRYVAIYFSDKFKKELFASLARVVAPSGYLVIGAVESLRGYSEAFVRRTHGSGAYYEYGG